MVIGFLSLIQGQNVLEYGYWFMYEEVLNGVVCNVGSDPNKQD